MGKGARESCGCGVIACGSFHAVCRIAWMQVVVGGHPVPPTEPLSNITKSAIKMCSCFLNARKFVASTVPSFSQQSAVTQSTFPYRAPPLTRR